MSMAAPPRRLLAGSSGCKRVAVPLSSVKARTEEKKNRPGVYSRRLCPSQPRAELRFVQQLTDRRRQRRNFGAAW